MNIKKSNMILGYRRSLSLFLAALFLLIGFQAFSPGILKNSRVEAATRAENKANRRATDTHIATNCTLAALDSDGHNSEFYKPCVARFKAFYLGDNSAAPNCPDDDGSGNYQYCQEAAPKNGLQARFDDFPNINKICGVFISNAKGGGWPNFSGLKGSNKKKAVNACNDGLGPGLTYAPGDYPANELCLANYKGKKTLLQACYAGESLADAHLFTLAEVKAIAKSGKLAKTNNGSSGGGGGGGVGGGSGGGGGPDCEAGEFSFNWVLCPIFDGTNAVTKFVFDRLIKPLLQTNPICLDASGSACDNTVYRIWSGFRIYGDIFLVIVLLVIVFGESIGGGMIDAYTAKKVLPRLLIAAILINLSVYIVALLIDITNVVGGGLGQLLTAPLKGQGAFTIQPSGITQGAIAAFGTTGLLVGGFVLGVTGIALLIVGLAITGVIALFGIFITLILRQTIILALLLISPVAFSLWCLPNTEQWFKRWWDTLFQMLLVYPMIVVLFAVADVMSYVTQHNGQGGPLSAIIAFMLLIIPLYLVPFTLRSSNRLLGMIHGAVSNVGKQVNAVTGRRALAGAGQEVGKNWESTKAGNRFRGGTEYNRRGRLNRFLQGATLATPGNVGFNPRRMRDRLEAARSSRTSALSAEAEKSEAARAVLGNDDLLAASIHGQGTEADAREYLEGLGQRGEELEQNVAHIRQAKRDMGTTNFEDFAAANLAGTGTGYAGGFVEMADSINRVAGGDRARAARILNSARGQAERAKRVDLYGPGFATSADVMSQLYNDDSRTPQERQQVLDSAQERITDEALLVKSAGEIGTSRHNGFVNMVPAIQRRLARAQATVQQAEQSGDAGAIAQANHEYKRVAAHTASLLDVAGSASPENAEVIGAVMGQNVQADEHEERAVLDAEGNEQISPITGKTITESVRTGNKTTTTFGEALSDLRNDREFQQYRREYGSSRESAAAEAVQPPEQPNPEAE